MLEYFCLFTQYVLNLNKNNNNYSFGFPWITPHHLKKNLLFFTYSFTFSHLCSLCIDECVQAVRVIIDLLIFCRCFRFFSSFFLLCVASLNNWIPSDDSISLWIYCIPSKLYPMVSLISLILSISNFWIFFKVKSSVWFATIGAWWIFRRNIVNLQINSVWSAFVARFGRSSKSSHTEGNGNNKSASSRSLRKSWNFCLKLLKNK